MPIYLCNKDIEKSSHVQALGHGNDVTERQNKCIHINILIFSASDLFYFVHQYFKFENFVYPKKRL